MPGSATDTKILQMQFENRQFERNIAQSQKSIEELKKAMNFDETSKGLGVFARGLEKLNLDTMANNIQKLTDKFTGLGTVSELVLSQIRRKIEEAAAGVSRFIDSMTTQQISAGMTKYEMLNKSVQTIKAATGESEADVYTVLDRLNQYTDQTSYNFSDMAQNIGKFTSVGIKLEAAERQMEGIANWAARSGAGINEASRAMYNLSQAMGVGKLTLIDWKSIENAGMATQEFKQQLIDSAVAAGTLTKKVTKDAKGVEKIVYETAKSLGKAEEVTTKNVGSTLNKGWATSEVLSATLEKYYYSDLFYELEEQLNKVMQTGQVLDAEEWSAIEELGFKSEAAKKSVLDLAVEHKKLASTVDKDGKTIYTAIDKNGEKIEFTVNEFEKGLASGWFDKEMGDLVLDMDSLGKTSYEAAQKCLTFTDVLGAWRDQVSTGWMTSFKIVLGELSESMDFFSDVCNRVGEALGTLIDFRNDILTSWAEQGGRQSLVDLIIGNYGDNVSDSAYGFLDVLEGLGKVMYQGFLKFIDLFADPDDSKMFRDEEQGYNYLVSWIGSKLKGITDGVSNFMKGIRDYFNEEVDIGGVMTTRIQVIYDIVGGIAAAMKLAYDVMTGIIGFAVIIGSQLSPSIDAVIGTLGNLGLALFGLADDPNTTNTILTFFGDLTVILQPVTSAINSVVLAIASLVSTLLTSDQASSTATGAFASFADSIKNIVGKIGSIVSPILGFITSLINILRELVVNGFDTESMANVGAKIKEAFNSMLAGMPTTVQKVINFFKNLYNNIKNVLNAGFSDESLSKLRDFLSNSFTSLYEGLPETIKGALASVQQKLQGIVQRFKDFFKRAFQSIQNVLQTGFSAESLNTFWETISSPFKKLYTKLPDAVKNTLTTIRTKLASVFGEFIKIVTQIFTSVRDFFTGGKQKEAVAPKDNVFSEAQDYIQESIETLTDSVDNTISAVGDKGKEYAVTLREFLASLNWKNILLYLGGAAGITVTARLIAKAIKAATAFFKGISKFGDVLKDGIELKFFKSDKKVETFAGKMLKLALAIGVFAVSMKMLGDMPLTNAIQGFAAIALLMAAMGIMSKAMIKAYDDVKPAEAFSMVLGMIGIAASIWILVKALLPLANLNINQFGNIAWGLVGVVAAFGIIGAMASKIDFSFKKTSGFLAIAGAVAILIFALNKIKDLNPVQLGKMAGSLIAILGILGLFAYAMNRLSVSMEGAGMGQIAALAGAVAILVFSLLPLSIVPLGGIAKMIGGLVGILGTLYAFMLLSRRLTMDGSAMMQLVALAGSIFILVLALMPLALLPLGRLAQGIIGIVVLIGALFGFMKLIGNSTMSATGMGQFTALAASVLILVLSLLPLAALDWSGLAKMGAGLVVTIGVLVGAMILINKFGGTMKGTGIAGFILMALAVGILVYTLMPLAALDTAQMQQFIVGLSAVVIALGILMIAVSAMSISSAVAGLLIMLPFALLMIALSAALSEVKDIDPAVISSFTQGLAILSVAIAAASILAKAGGLGGMAVLAAGIAMIVGVIALLAPFLMGSLASGFSQIAGHLTMISGMLETFSGRMSGVDESGIGKTQRMIEGIKEILGSLAGVGSYSANIGDFTTTLFDLSTGLEIFATHTGNVGDLRNNSAIQLIKELSACAGDMDMITKMNLGNLTSNLSGLGGAMMLYAQGAKEATGLELGETPDVTAAVSLLSAISASLTENGGFTVPSNMPDETSLGNFGAQLAALAGALVQFEQAGGGLGEGTDKALDTLDFFQKLKQKLVDTEFDANLASTIGIFGEGENAVKTDQLTEFGKNIEQLGLALSQFAISTTYADDATGEIKPINFDNATAALETFVDIKSKLKVDLGPVLTFLVGKRQTLLDMGAEIEGIGQALNDFSNKVTGETNGHKNFDTEATSVAIGALDQMITFMQQLQEKLPKIGGLSNIISTLARGRDMTLNDLGTQIAGLGDGLGNLGAGLAKGNWDTNLGVDVAFDALNSILNVMLRLEEMSGFTGSAYANLDKLAMFTRGLNQDIEVFNSTTIAKGEIISNITQFMGDLNNGIVQMAGGAENLAAMHSNLELFRMFAEGLNSLTNSNLDISWDIIGTNLTTEVAGAITAGASSVNLAVITMLTGAQTAGIAHEGVDYTGIGTAVASGTAVGIAGGIPTVTAAAQRMAQAAYAAAMAKLNAHSPSRVFMDVGDFIGQGMAIGIANSTMNVQNAVADMSNQTIETAGNMMATISRIMAEGADANPTITPVLDLSQVLAGMGELDGLSGRTIGLDTALSASRAGTLGQGTLADTAAAIQNGINLDGVYERMNSLTERIGALGDKIASMKLVLDSGVVAGGVTDGVDTNLGRKMLYAGRRN